MAATVHQPPESSAAREFLQNLRDLPRTVKDAIFRVGGLPQSEREESQALRFEHVP